MNTEALLDKASWLQDDCVWCSLTGQRLYHKYLCLCLPPRRNGQLSCLRPYWKYYCHIYRYLKVYKYVIICKLFFRFCSSLEAYSCFSGLLPLLSPGTLLKSCLRSALDCSGWKLSRRVCWQLNRVWARVASLITDRCFSSFHLLQNDVVAEGAWITVPALGGTVFLEWALRWFLHWAQE